MKTYVITPSDSRIAKQAKAVWVVNEFKHKGFNTQKRFLEIVHLHNPEMNNVDDTRKLVLFWLFRNLKFVSELEKLVNKL